MKNRFITTFIFFMFFFVIFADRVTASKTPSFYSYLYYTKQGGALNSDDIYITFSGYYDSALDTYSAKQIEDALETDIYKLPDILKSRHYSNLNLSGYTKSIILNKISNTPCKELEPLFTILLSNIEYLPDNISYSHSSSGIGYIPKKEVFGVAIFSDPILIRKINKCDIFNSFSKQGVILLLRNITSLYSFDAPYYGLEMPSSAVDNFLKYSFTGDESADYKMTDLTRYLSGKNLLYKDKILSRLKTVLEVSKNEKTLSEAFRLISYVRSQAALDYIVDLTSKYPKLFRISLDNFLWESFASTKSKKLFEAMAEGDFDAYTKSKILDLTKKINVQLAYDEDIFNVINNHSLKTALITSLSPCGIDVAQVVLENYSELNYDFKTKLLKQMNSCWPSNLSDIAPLIAEDAWMNGNKDADTILSSGIITRSNPEFAKKKVMMIGKTHLNESAPLSTCALPIDEKISVYSINAPEAYLSATQCSTFPRYDDCGKLKNYYDLLLGSPPSVLTDHDKIVYKKIREQRIMTKCGAYPDDMKTALWSSHYCSQKCLDHSMMTWLINNPMPEYKDIVLDSAAKLCENAPACYIEIAKYFAQIHDGSAPAYLNKILTALRKDPLNRSRDDNDKYIISAAVATIKEMFVDMGDESFVKEIIGDIDKQTQWDSLDKASKILPVLAKTCSTDALNYLSSLLDVKTHSTQTKNRITLMLVTAKLFCGTPGVEDDIFKMLTSGNNEMMQNAFMLLMVKNDPKSIVKAVKYIASFSREFSNPDKKYIDCFRKIAFFPFMNELRSIMFGIIANEKETPVARIAALSVFHQKFKTEIHPLTDKEKATLYSLATSQKQYANDLSGEMKSDAFLAILPYLTEKESVEYGNNLYNANINNIKPDIFLSCNGGLPNSPAYKTIVYRALIDSSKKGNDVLTEWLCLKSLLKSKDIPMLESLSKQTKLYFIESEWKLQTISRRAKQPGIDKAALAAELRDDAWKNFRNYERGDKYLENYEFRRKIEALITKELSLSLALNGNDPYALSLMSRAYSRFDQNDENNTKKAFDYALKSVKAGPDIPQSHHALANAYNRNRQSDLEIKELRIALEKDPNYYRAMLNLSVREAAAGNYDKAVSYYERAKKLIPDEEKYLLIMVPPPQKKNDIKK